MFGAGCYFAEDVEKVDQYARPDKGPEGPDHEKLAGLHARLYKDGRTHPGTAFGVWEGTEVGGWRRFY